MVSDGMGLDSLRFAEGAAKVRGSSKLELSKYMIGTTSPKQSYHKHGPMDDTSIACGINSDSDQSVGLMASGLPAGTILEAAKKAGYLTGLVVTSRITDDTPASFTSHVRNKFDEDLVAEHQLGLYPFGRAVDLMIGGGRCRFTSSVNGGCRNDDKDLWAQARTGWTLVESMDQFSALNLGKNVSLPLLALMSPGDLPFEADRDEARYPSLLSTTTTAINALSDASKKSESGFFLVVEGSRIDSAAHQQDPVALYHEIAAFDKAFSAAVTFAEQSDVETTVISVSNHGTSELEQVGNVPAPLALGSKSGSYVASIIRGLNSDSEDIKSRIVEAFEKYYSINDLSKTEIGEVSYSLAKSSTSKIISKIVSSRLLIAWGSNRHNTAPVGLYAYTPKQRIAKYLSKHFAVQSSRQTTHVTEFLEKLMHVDMGEVTKMLNQVRKDSPKPIAHGLSNMESVSDWTGINLAGIESKPDTSRCAGSR